MDLDEDREIEEGKTGDWSNDNENHEGSRWSWWVELIFGEEEKNEYQRW